MNRERVLRRRIYCATWFFIAGLVASGVTAIPLQSELDLLVKVFGANESAHSSVLGEWLSTVREALHRVSDEAPFLFYGTDWLAFGHFVIAIAFFGVLKDPIRNRWLFTFGLCACALVVPYAVLFGGIRGIPFWWRLIDCGFGVIGFVPLYYCRRWTAELEGLPSVLGCIQKERRPDSESGPPLSPL